MVFAELRPAQRGLVDRVAQTTTAGTLGDVRRLYDSEGVRVPGAVTSHRFGRTVSVMAAV